jgi:hypothetical protein
LKNKKKIVKKKETSDTEENPKKKKPGKKGKKTKLKKKAMSFEPILVLSKKDQNILDADLDMKCEVKD